jgi:hypothetical protein
MARLGHWGAESGHYHAENLTLTGTTLTLDTAVKRTGTSSFKFDASAANYLVFTFSGVALRTYYFCGHFYIPAASGLPGANANILQLAGSGGGSIISAWLTTGGKIQARYANTDTQLGSDSAATITTDTWYRIEASYNVNTAAGADDALELRLDGTTVASGTVAASTSAPGLVQFGWRGDPGTSEVIHWDDLALNDDQGSVNNTWIGDQKVYVLLPTADSARANWTDGAGGTTTLWEAVNNIPPTGVATASSGATNQVENPTSGTASYDATMTTYTAAGVVASDTITALYTVIEAGSSSTTGSDTMTHELVSNPAVAALGTNSVDIVAGTYPASWNRGQGTITENPSVVLGTAPVMRITKTAAVTRIHTVCFMGIMVAVLPNQPKSAPDSQALTAVSTATVDTGPVAKEAPDTETLDYVDTATVAATAASPDTQALTATDAATMTYAVTVPDTQALTAVSTATKEEDITPKASPDAETLDYVDTATVTAAISAEDSQALTATDTATFTYPLTTDDSQALTAIDTAEVALAKDAPDAQALTVVETVAAPAALASPDAQALTATDSADFAYSPDAIADTQALTALSEATVDMTEPKASPDAQALTAVSTATVAAAFTIADTQALTVAEFVGVPHAHLRAIISIG